MFNIKRNGALLAAGASIAAATLVISSPFASSASSVQTTRRAVPTVVTTAAKPTSTTTAAPTTLPPTTTTPLPPVTAPPLHVHPAAVGVNAFLACIGLYESGNRYGITSGRYGILISTWVNYGFAARFGTATPGQATPAQQDEAAMELYRRYGSQPWSTRGLCGG